MERREHDIMMDMIANQGMSFDNLVTVGLNVGNTSLQDRSTYENNDWVREHFKDQYGEFDKQSFDAFYNNAKVYYNALASANYEESMKRQATYHRDNIFAPIEQRRKGPEYISFESANPYQITSSIHELGRVGERTKSIDELAQANRVLLNPKTAGANLENAQWGDTPNDSFWGYFTDTLVMAQYDSDGEHLDPFTEKMVQHKAGELKLDNDGNFYYEKLDGRDVYGRRVLNKMNVLTTDGSFWNRYDFFDSDDLNQKSIGGSILKNLALVGTMFIPYVGPWITGLSIATQAAGLLGTLGKMVGGSDAPTWSAIEGWSKSVSRQGAVSEYAQEHTWCWENFINLIGDVAGQLKEQRFIFEKVPYVFKGANMMTKEGQAAKLAALEKKQLQLTQSTIDDLRKTGASAAELLRAETELKTVAALKAQAELDSFIKGYNKLGEVLSKGYMTAVTVGDTYGEAKQAGASDLDATLLTLGYAAGEYAILSTGLGEWILPELRAGRYKSQAIARALTQIDAETSNLYKQFGRQLSNFSKEGKKEYTKKLFKIGRDIARAEYANGSKAMTATLASAAGEGFEEVSEELLADFSKGCYDVVKWLQGDNTRINTFGYDFEKGTWDGSEILDRYGMSLVGGFVGGGLTNLGTNYKMVNSFNNMTSEQAIQEIVYMARNGGLRDFLRQVNKMQLGDPNLSATEYEVEGNNIVFSPGTKENNQDLYIKKALRNQVKMIEGILQANGAVSDSKFLDQQTLGDLRFNALHKSSTAGRYLQEYNSLSTRLIRLVSQINDKVNSVADTNGDGIVTDREQRRAKLSQEEQAAVKSLEDELKEVKKQMEDLVSGKRAYEFIADSLFEMTTALSGSISAPTFPLYAEWKYGRKFSELTENDKAVAYEEYKNWAQTEKGEQLHILSQIYRKVAEQSSQVIRQHAQDYVQTSRDLLALNAAISRLYTEVSRDGQMYYLPLVADETLYLELAQDAADTEYTQVGTKLAQLLGSEQDVAELRSILERANTIDPNASDAEKLSQRKQIGIDYANKLDEILINNIQNFVQPILDRGFANAETKNQLIQLLKVVQNRAMAQIAEWDYWAENNLSSAELLSTPNPYAEAMTQTMQLIRTVDALSATPIEQNLNEFAISIGKEPINLTQLIERLNASFNDVSDNVTKFNMDQQLRMDLENAINTLKLYQMSIRGARTDGANLSNIFGYNATLNEVLEKLEGAKSPQLAEIDKNVADIFDEDIKANLNKLQFLKRLYDINQGAKLSKQDRVATKKDLLIYKRLKHIVSVLDDDPLTQWEGFIALQAAINGMTIHERLLNENNTVVGENEREAFEREKLAAENAIYEFFQIESNKQKLNDPTKLAEFINPSRLQLYTEATELLNEGLESLDDNSLVWWIASRAALRSSDFYYQYKQIIDPEAEQPMAPIATQELAIYNNYASIINGNVFTAFYNAYRYAITEDWKRKSVTEREEILERLGKEKVLASDELAKFSINFLSAPRYQNIILTEGIPGSGKSTGVFQSTLKMLKQFHPEVLSSVAVVHGANADSAVGLRDSIGLSQENSKTYGREEWMKEINPNWKEYSKDEATNAYQVPKSDYTITAENEIRSSLGVKDTTNPPKLIIIDEVSKFSAYDLDQIDALAKKYGITVLVAGDFDQSGVVGSHKVSLTPNLTDLVWQIELSRVNFMRSPKLGVSMRTDNSLKTQNLQKLQAYMQDPEGVCELNYFQDETGLYGDQLIQYGDGETSQNVLFQVLEQVQKMIDTLKEGEKIGLIYSNKTSPIYQALSKDEYKKFIDFREGGSAQGLEGQYYIIEANSNSTVKEYLKDIYTGMSRAQQGSIIIAPLTYEGIKFNSTQISEKIGEQLSVNTIAAFAKKRKEVLDKVASEGQISQIIPRNASNIPAVQEQSPANRGLQPGISSEPPAPLDPALKAQAIESLQKVSTQEDLDYWKYQSNLYDPRLLNDPDIQSLVAQKEQELAQSRQLGSMPFQDRFQALVSQGILDNVWSNTNGREIVVANVNGIKLPFYRSSSGTDGKQKGKWYPFFGFGKGSRSSSQTSTNENNWLIKGSIEDMEVGYNIPEIQNVQNLLNEQFNWPQDIAFNSPTVHNFIDGQLLSGSQLNELVLGAEESGVQNGVNSEKHIKDFLERIQQGSNLPAPEVPEVETLSYEDDIAPITQTDIINETQYQQQIDEASETKNVAQATAEIRGERVSIDMLLHSFNTFETGVTTDQNGMPAPIGSQQWMDARIDSVNGLVRIDKALGRPIRTVQEYVDLIGRLRSILFNTLDKSTIQEKLQNILGLSEIYCTFALKSSPRPGTQNRASGREFVGNNPNPFEKGISEETLFNGSTDTRSQELNLKSLVVIVGTKSSGNLLELPLVTLNSPFTLLQTKDGNGQQVFSQMFNDFNQLLKQNVPLYDIALQLIDKYDKQPQYQELVDLFKLFTFTDGAVFYVDDPQWTPAKDLQLVGPQFVTDKGYYQVVPGLSMNDTTNPEAEWISVSEFTKNPQCYVTKNVMVSMTGYVDGIDVPIVNAGHPFVLVSFNRDLNTDDKVMRQYIEQQRNPSARTEVKLMYVLPPKATIEEYLDNVYKILTKSQDIKAIGNLFTSYKLLKVLMQDNAFRTRLQEKMPGAVEAVDKAIQDLDKLSQAEQKDMLYESFDWTKVGGLGKQKLAGLFDAVLLNVAYSRQSLRENFAFNKNVQDTQLIIDALAKAGIDGVYHKVKISKNSTQNDYFMIPDQGTNYTLNGMPFRIHGKLDSYTFRGAMGSLISSVLGKIRQGNNGHFYSTDNRTYVVWNQGIGSPGNSDITAKPVRSKQETETERLKRNTLDYIRKRVPGIDLSIYDRVSLQEANKNIVEQINASGSQIVAFTIGNQIAISYVSDRIQGPIYIYDNNDEPITDISELSDNNGKYTLTLSALVDGKQAKVTATYDAVKKEIEIIPPMEVQPTATISVTSENFSNYIEVGRRLLEPIFDMDILLADVFNAQSYEEFMTGLQNMIYLGDMRIQPLEQLLEKADTLQAQIINDIIAIERSNDPSKQDVLEDTNCPLPIKIKF